MLNEKELIHLENILRALRKAKFDDMQGLEVLALASAYHFLDDLIKKEKDKPKQIAPAALDGVKIKGPKTQDGHRRLK